MPATEAIHAYYQLLRNAPSKSFLQKLAGMFNSPLVAVEVAPIVYGTGSIL